MKFKDLTCNFCAFSCFFLFYLYISWSVFTRFEWKLYQNLEKMQGYTPTISARSWTSLRTAVFSGLSQKNWEDRDRWSAWTGYSPIWFSVPFWSYEPDLEALVLGLKTQMHLKPSTIADTSPPHLDLSHHPQLGHHPENNHRAQTVLLPLLGPNKHYFIFVFIFIDIFIDVLIFIDIVSN